MQGLRSGITQEQKMIKAHMVFLETNYNSKPFISFQFGTPKLNSLYHHNTYSVMKCRNDYFKNFSTTDVVRE